MTFLVDQAENSEHERGLEQLDEAQRAHAEKNVQVAANGAHKILERHLGLLLDKRVGEGIVEHTQLETQLARYVRRRRRRGVELHVAVIRIQVLRDGEAQRTLATLERTLGQAHAVYVVAGGEHAARLHTRAVQLRLGHAKLKVSALGRRWRVAQRHVQAAAGVRDEQLFAQRNTVGLGIGERALGESVEQRRVVEPWAYIVAVFEHRAVAIGRRVLLRERALQHERGAQTGPQLERSASVRILGAVLYESMLI